MRTENGHRRADEESLLSKAGPQGKDAQDELQVQVCGVPVQAVSGLAFCAGGGLPFTSYLTQRLALSVCRAKLLL